jgi:phosphoglycerate kinase
MAKKTIDDVEVAGKRVLVRVDFNVPLAEDRSITDDTRIRAALPTLWHLLENGASLVLMTHLGRPRGQRQPAMSLAPVARLLHNLLGTSVHLAPDCVGDEVEAMARDLLPGQVLLLENLRFHAEEEANDPAFARSLAALGDLFVNDAFGTAHRAHASTDGITRHFPHNVSGYLMAQEMKYLTEALTDPPRPFVAILGGAKVSGKVEVIENLLEKVDTLIIGGGMAFTFFKAMGLEIGDSLLEEETLGVADRILTTAGKMSGIELLLPVDCLVADRMAADAQTQVVARDAIPPGWQGVDIGPQTTRLFKEKVSGGGAVLWNGPVGVFEIEPFSTGTFDLARAVERVTWESGAITILGGGDTAAAAAQAGISASRVSHISTGGGASLECLAGRTLPGVAALDDAD